MTKKYNSPLLQIVSIKNDIVTASGDPILSGTYNGSSTILGADRFREFEDYSY